jgi:hypothetical protein
LDDWVLYVGMGLAAVLALWIALWALRQTLSGAAIIFEFAAVQGFLGVAAYVALWVLLLPIMVLICFGTGVFVNTSVNKALAKERRRARGTNAWRQKHLGEKPWQQDPSIPPDDPKERVKWSNREPPYDK